MTEKKFTNFKYSDEFTLHFDVFGYDCSFANAIRRTILSKVPTLGFRTAYGKESDMPVPRDKYRRTALCVDCPVHYA